MSLPSDTHIESPSKRLCSEAVRNNCRILELGQETLTIELMQGDVELIYVTERLGQDGFLHPIRQEIENSGMVSHRLNLVRVLTRCVSADDDSILYNERATGKDGKVYPRLVIARMVDPLRDNSTETRKAVLIALANLLNSKTGDGTPANDVAKRMQAKRANAHANKYVVPINYDITPIGSPRKLCEVIVTRQVVEYIYTAYDNVSKKWAIENPDLAKQFFNYPYPQLAINELGYPITPLE